MKLIEIAVRNTMTDDDRLSGLMFIAIERDIHLSFEQIINKFSDIH